MPYNFTKKPKEIITVGDPNGIFIEVPLYGDLINKEAEQLENLTIQYQKWTQKLFKLAQDISKAKDLSLAQVLSLVSSDNLEDQANAFGEYLLALTNHSLAKPTESDRLTETALILLTSRVDPAITKQDVLDLPLEFVKQLNDVVFQETAKEYLTVQSLKEENSLLSEMVNLADSAIHSCIDLVGIVEKTVSEEYHQDLAEVSANLSGYFDLKASLGK